MKLPVLVGVFMVGVLPEESLRDCEVAEMSADGVGAFGRRAAKGVCCSKEGTASAGSVASGPKSRGCWKLKPPCNAKRNARTNEIAARTSNFRSVLLYTMDFH